MGGLTNSKLEDLSFNYYKSIYYAIYGAEGMINYILKYQYLPSTKVTTVVRAIYGYPFSQKNMVLNNVKLKVVLKWRNIYFENIRVVSLIDGLKIEGSLKMEES